MLNQQPVMPQAGRQPLSRADAAMLADGFPKQLRTSVCCVCDRIPMRTYYNVGWAVSEDQLSWLLPDGQAIAFPYRLYILDGVPAGGNAILARFWRGNRRCGPYPIF